MIAASERRSWLADRDPGLKLAIVFALSVAGLFLVTPLPLVLLELAALAVAVLAARVPPRTLLVAHGPFLTFGLGLVAINALTRPGEVIAPDWPVRVTLEGLTFGIVLALRALVIGALMIAFLATTPPDRLLASLMQHARLPPRVGFAVLAAHRLLVLLPREWAVIRRAHAVRARLDRRGRPIHGVRGTLRAAFALLVVAIRSGERLAMALESRGLGSGPRTVWRPVPLDRRDLGLVVVAALGTTVAISAPALLGA